MRSGAASCAGTQRPAVAHFNNAFAPASNWRGNYMAVGHWVAQFGLFALQPLFGPEAGR
jgi:hypothetical protein